MATPPAAWRLPHLRIDRNGDWFDGDVQVTHPGVLRNLRAGLRRDSDGYFIQTNVRIPVEVDDVPWVITRLEPRAGGLHAQVNDDTEEIIDPASIRIGPGHVPYCTIKGGAFTARLDRAAAYQLLSLADYDEVSERGTLRLDGRIYALGPDGAEPRSG
jgi:hypothetical protein